ncbi:MAG: hypothetical protein ACKE5Q_00690 [Methylophilaceae bacterium]
MKSFLQRILVKNTKRESSKLTSWIFDLAGMDDIAALKLSTQQTALLIDEEKLTTDQKLDFIIELEEINHTRLDKLSHQFASLTNLKPELENSIADTCYTYSRQSYIYHLKMIERVIDPSKFEPNEDKLLLVLARTINATFNMLKWRAFVQQNQPTKVWLQTYLLYKVAHKQNLLNTPIELFPLSPATTLSAYIVQICMFGQLRNASLEKQHIQVTEKVLRIWLTHAHISQQHNPEQYLFYIDLEKDIEAKRIRQLEPNEHCRYWELDDLEKKIAIAITTSGRGEFPDSLILSKIDDPKVLNEALSILHAEWTKNQYVRQRRSEAREATSENAKVKAGILDICDQVLGANQLNSGLKLSRQGDSLNDLLVGQSVFNQSNALGINSGSLDTWIITDKSTHGLGARVNKYANTLARPKKLIGLVFDDDPTKVSIGIIRMVQPTQGNLLRVGIEIFSNLAIWTQLKLSRDNDAFAEEGAVANKASLEMRANTNIFPGIYLPKDPGLSEQATMILPKLDFRPNTKYTIYINGKTKHFEFDEPIESYDDWVKVAIDF